ncbi:UNVERIFIED_CONTAM: Transcription factor R-4 [Sesamum angustifolium]|uniref:Transcription factor R-4 n=1 Tax=Sesamum angustifolium TaxID=2727405 RepID=A0AAW2MBT5_9LAMI
MESDRTSNNTLSDGGRNFLPRARPLHGRTSGPTRRSTKGQWTAEEDEILRMAVQRFKGKNWKKIGREMKLRPFTVSTCVTEMGPIVLWKHSECFKDRTDVQCLHRWQKVLNPELVKGPWSKEEDEIIIELVSKLGPKKWSTIAQHLPGRIGKQCRERWHNHLNPNINKEAWTQEEELALIRAHQIYGNKWAELTKFLPGRFVETPFNRSIESPSAWKSPWFINTFVPGPRIDTDITIEDIGYFLSPGDRSYDAIGLMKQLGEQTAGAFADAQEVLGDETPETIMKGQCSANQEGRKENNNSPSCLAEYDSALAANFMTERRTLDFSECATPAKETGKSSTALVSQAPLLIC